MHEKESGELAPQNTPGIYLLQLGGLVGTGCMRKSQVNLQPRILQVYTYYSWVGWWGLDAESGELATQNTPGMDA